MRRHFNTIFAAEKGFNKYALSITIRIWILALKQF